MTAHLKCSHSPYACVHRNSTVTETHGKILPEEIKQNGLPHRNTLKLSGSPGENFKYVHFDTFLNEKEIKNLGTNCEARVIFAASSSNAPLWSTEKLSGQGKTGFAAGKEAVNDVVVAAHQRSYGFFWFILRRLWDLGRHMQSNFTRKDEFTCPGDANCCEVLFAETLEEVFHSLQKYPW